MTSKEPCGNPISFNRVAPWRSTCIVLTAAKSRVIAGVPNDCSFWLEDGWNGVSEGLSQELIPRPLRTLLQEGYHQSASAGVMHFLGNPNYSCFE